mmetsp:Transcript_22553/g.70992  ORF Transcript_22553/g.70992 Transcript_22553/m.70992 type:complete len:224 (+) Transcript_22553:76-747(+)
MARPTLPRRAIARAPRAPTTGSPATGRSRMGLVPCDIGRPRRSLTPSFTLAPPTSTRMLRATARSPCRWSQSPSARSRCRPLPPSFTLATPPTPTRMLQATATSACRRSQSPSARSRWSRCRSLTPSFTLATPSSMSTRMPRATARSPCRRSQSPSAWSRCRPRPRRRWPRPRGRCPSPCCRVAASSPTPRGSCPRRCSGARRRPSGGSSPRATTPGCSTTTA